MSLTGEMISESLSKESTLKSKAMELLILATASFIVTVAIAIDIWKDRNNQ